MSTGVGNGCVFRFQSSVSRPFLGIRKAAVDGWSYVFQIPSRERIR
jgi:hypothetical protein